MDSVVPAGSPTRTQTAQSRRWSGGRRFLYVVLVTAATALAALTVFTDPRAVVVGIIGLLGAALAFGRTRFWIFATFMVLILNQSHYPIVGILGPVRWVPLLFFCCLAILLPALRSRLHRSPARFDIPLLGWIVFAFLTASYSIDPGLTIGRAATLLLMYVAVFWVIWETADRKGDHSIIDLFLIAIAITYFLSFIELALGRAFDAGRFRGIAGNANGLGLLTALLFPLVFYRALAWKRITEILLLAVMLLVVVMTGSRGTLLAIVASGGYMLWRYGPAFRAAAVATGTMITLALTGVLPMPAAVDEYYRIGNLLSGSGRMEAWPILASLLRESWILGYGFGTEDAIFESQDFIFFEFAGGHAHNSYLGLALQVGLAGALAFFLPLAALLVTSMIRSRRDRYLMSHHAYEAVLLAGFVSAMVESWIYSMGNMFAFPFWICVMLLIRQMVKRDNLLVFGGEPGYGTQRPNVRENAVAAAS